MTSPRSSTPVAQRRLPFGVRLAIWGVVGILLYYVFLVAAQYFTPNNRTIVTLTSTKGVK